MKKKKKKNAKMVKIIYSKTVTIVTTSVHPPEIIKLKLKQNKNFQNLLYSIYSW